jgi:hypothetical protein
LVLKTAGVKNPIEFFREGLEQGEVALLSTGRLGVFRQRKPQTSIWKWMDLLNSAVINEEGQMISHEKSGYSTKTALLMIVALLLWSLVFATMAFSQATDANLTGTVLDSSGAAVPGASLEIVNVATGVKATATADAAGAYRFSNLLGGTYTVTATAKGFKTTSFQKLDLAPNKTSTVNITLEVGATATVVEVSEAGVVIDTTSAQLTNNFEAREAMDLPTAAGSVLNLSLLGAGVASNGGIGAGSGPSIGGQRPRNNNFMIEGMDNNQQSVTGPIVTVPNDSVSSFTVLQNQFSAEFGHSAAGQFLTNIKSGTNEIHGVAYEYFNNRKLNALDQAQYRACDQAQLAAGTCKPRYDNNRFGGGVGGPVIKNKLFFYGSVEYSPYGAQGNLSSQVYSPTAEGFAVLDRMTNLSANNYAMFKKYVAPAPAGTGDNIQVNGLDVPLGILPTTAPNFSNTWNIVTSVDYNLSSKDQMRGRYVYNKTTTLDTAAMLSNFYQDLLLPSQVATFSEFHNFSPSLINEFRLGFNRYTQNYTVGSQQFTGLEMFPNLTFDELNWLNVGPDPNAPQTTVENKYQVVDNVSWIKGKHTFKFGAEYRRIIGPQTFTQRVRGDYEYSSLEVYLKDLSPDSFGERSNGFPTYYGNNTQFYLFANDTWALKPNLSLNLGVRYEYVTPTDGQKLQTINSISSVPGLITFGDPKAQTKNFAPRIGLAYSPGTSGNTSIRAGFGMGYDILFDNLGILSLPPQLQTTSDVDTSVSSPDFLKNGGLPASLPNGGALSQEEARAYTGSYIPDQVRPVSVNWNLSAQHVWRKDYTFEVRYVGTRGYHLPLQTRLNRISKVWEGHSLPTYLAMPSQTDLNNLPLTLNTLNSQVSNIWADQGFQSNVVGFMPWGNSAYHGLQTQVNRRFSRGLMFIGAYTWSKAMDDSTAEVFSTYLTPRRQEDFLNIHAGWSRSALDRTHRFSFSAIYELPFLKNSSNAFAKKALGGWQVAGTYIAESPEYATVQSAVDSNLNGDNAGDRVVVNPAGVDGTGSGVTALKNSAGQTVAYLAKNPNARYIVAGTGVLPTGGRNTLPMRGINNVDFNLSKSFKITESKSFILRADAYNFFNHPQFTPGNLSSVWGVSNTATRSYLVPSDSGFNQLDNNFPSHARSVSIALKFVF